jgi:TPR repeat protein
VANEFQLAKEFHCFFTAEEGVWLEKYGDALDALSQGERVAITPAQAAFVAVAAGNAIPSSIPEKLWMRYLLVRRVMTLRERLANLEAFVESIAKIKRAILVKDFGLDPLVNSNHPTLLRICADHYLHDDPTDPAKAMPLALRASELGDGEAAHIVGLLYDYGLGCPQDLTKAMDYYKLAAERGVEQAKTKVSNLGPSDPSTPWIIVGNGTSVASRHNSADDWSYTTDDFGSEQWESIMGGPDDDYFEKREG